MLCSIIIDRIQGVYCWIHPSNSVGSTLTKHAAERTWQVLLCVVLLVLKDIFISLPAPDEILYPHTFMITYKLYERIEEILSEWLSYLVFLCYLFSCILYVVVTYSSYFLLLYIMYVCVVFVCIVLYYLCAPVGKNSISCLTLTQNSYSYTAKCKIIWVFAQKVNVTKKHKQ